MGNIFFTIKIAIITIVLILLMQIQVDNKTIEAHIESYVKTSMLISPIREVAHGGFAFFKSGYHWTSKTVDSFFSKNFRSENSPGRRKLTEIKRSLGFKKEQEKKQKTSSENNEVSEEVFVE